MFTMKKILAFAFRIDNLDRIIVFVSMAMFLVMPTYVLYYTDETNQVTDIVIRCITLIGAIVGTGTMTLVRPIRTTFFYFLELVIIYILQFSDFSPDGFDFNFTAVFWIQIVYCLIGFAISLISYLHYAKRKKKQAGAVKEDTNEDTLYDFLNATSANKHIEDDIENIMDDKEKEKMKKRKQAKFSRLARIFSFGIVFVTLMIYYITSMQKKGTSYIAVFSGLNLLAMILIALTFLGSLKFPRDYKYLYFYTAGFFLTLILVISKEFQMRPVFLIIDLVILMLSFLIALIVEGRTWMGGTSE